MRSHIASSHQIISLFEHKHITSKSTTLIRPKLNYIHSQGIQKLFSISVCIIHRCWPNYNSNKSNVTVHLMLPIKRKCIINKIRKNSSKSTEKKYLNQKYQILVKTKTKVYKFSYITGVVNFLDQKLIHHQIQFSKYHGILDMSLSVCFNE